MRGSSSPYKDNEKSYLCSWNEKVDPPCLLAAPGRPVDGGLRNLTLNATALPMVTPLNLVRTGETPQDAPYENRPTFTPATRGAFEDFTVKAKLNLHF